MPRLRSPQPETRTDRAWWCPRHGWWIDDHEYEAENSTPECGVHPCGGRAMAGPFDVTIAFHGTPASTADQAQQQEPAPTTPEEG